MGPLMNLIRWDRKRTKAHSERQDGDAPTCIERKGEKTEQDRDGNQAGIAIGIEDVTF